MCDCLNENFKRFFSYQMIRFIFIIIYQANDTSTLQVGMYLASKYYETWTYISV